MLLTIMHAQIVGSVDRPSNRDVKSTDGKKINAEKDLLDDVKGELRLM